MGTTSARSINPKTDKKYGPDFPVLSFEDFIHFHKCFLEEMGVETLFLMAGPSMGSMQSLLMAALYSNCVISVATALNTYDLGKNMSSYSEGVLRITCPVLMANFITDHEFQPFWAEEVAGILNARTPNQAKVLSLDSKWGHLGCTKDAALFEPPLREFMSGLG